MEIGGSDLFFPVSLEPSAALLLVKEVVAKHWPEAVYENADPDDADSLDVFIYQDQAAKDIWDVDCPENMPYANMIYALFGDGQVTLVHDKETPSETLAYSIKDSF
jgi:hypothetical protein